ncbi:hypothetical protein HMPREF1982_01210 [Clostridiales bacterium oral taxon 876 str. F0540]|nr:hypothetical protein HMPREF1982_01210 [Clostridiales bacterium oral taxon 876 str. F0540]
MPSLGKVSLERKDWDNEYKRMIIARARSVSKFVNRNDELFDILCQFILENKTKDYFNTNFDSWTEEVKLLNKTLKIAEMEAFINALRAAYENSRSDSEISDFRGKLFEVIVEDIYSKKYQSTRTRISIFEKGCEVEINKNKIHYWNEDPNKEKSTVDVAGYNVDNSEFYEVKVGPSNFTHNVIEYLNLLKCVAVEEKISSSIFVGCMTMDTRAYLKQNLTKVKIKDRVDYKGLEIMGREDIKKLF